MNYPNKKGPYLEASRLLHLLKNLIDDPKGVLHCTCIERTIFLLRAVCCMTIGPSRISSQTFNTLMMLMNDTTGYSIEIPERIKSSKEPKSFYMLEPLQLESDHAIRRLHID